jgi:5-methylcytosine-specific restriction endonuclease McrA
MPAKIHLPEAVIVERWLHDLSATTRTIAKEFNCSFPTIILVLRRHLDAETIDKVKRSKMSTSTAARPDLKTKEHKAMLDQVRVLVQHNTAKGVETSVHARKGKKLSKEHRDKLALAHTGINSGEQSSNWRGGTSKVCWRGKGWTVARRLARERDNNTCQTCGVTALEQGKNMDVHHRVSYFSFASAEEANALTNLICLCRRCHRKVENGTLQLL